ncbi:MAG: hypothetical protein GY785_24350 [Gammaproteobacteria bacterium]|nr:hypothetical protein [Gammaproteobacteria bacterium]MCP4979866.1 hypothetical protein [Gammaproteobacteria bacterium]
MSEDLGHKKRSTTSRSTKSGIITWVKVCVVILMGLITLRFVGLQIFFRIDYDDEPIITALSEIETYYLPLALLLVCFVAAGIWRLFFGSKDD